ncbi:glutamine-hydrolyzing carbamoyl-phosphate synthase small subunit [Aneurinibacillus sp. Ricciae_BoGa-3]|uniref:glutamine-hydrolyzing carbamoyl-phosphate synthase small subunit n=1 Tax=Aneurinibacillus sp. Ricciae_BoGa-3 TaxID=3022697 RepID=UPI00233FFBF7|nr:glutamine-hydrolyzing carbamoyl-phosphate synthase small subunit [Aneurinibacillus sp. Ricciae_BoGa-3]WCK53054.1 glutamine-hydrolyzing carbamoyl-phosphate synthase small subunit [Aneurinibacillus sp. Ricciae_BoGa-3]
MNKWARLVLEDGTVFQGKSFGAAGESLGEVVFNTGMTGYQEVLSDPSYCGQIVTMTYPLIGNYGINRDDFESIRPFVHGFVVREHCEYASNWRNEESLDSLLKEYNIPGIAEIDTRKLTRLIRRHGTLKGVLTTADTPIDSLLESLKAPFMTDQVSRVSTKNMFAVPGQDGPRIVLVDFGAKQGILRELTKRSCDVIVVPYNVGADEIRRIRPDGVFLSNGPGDPKDVPEAVTMLREILGSYPVFGVCLGHQLLALACGADTAKLTFGHRGGNHPVKELATGRTHITSQNHGYAVTAESVQGTDLEVSHISLNDNTVEGLVHKIYPAFSVQYHPEAAPGPFDSGYLFDRFLEQIAQHKKGDATYATTR